MTGAGAPGAAGILKCLRQDSFLHITAADANPEAAGKHLAADFATIPRADDPSFIPALFSLCKEKSIRVVMPLVTKELLLFANAKEQFEKAGITLLVSNAASLEIANNKSRLYEFLQWRDIAVPDFRIVETVEQFREAVTALGYPEKPVCFKPSVSNGSRGFRIIDGKINEADLLFNYKPNNTYIKFDDAQRILGSAPFPELLVSEYLPGEEYSVDCLVNNGQTIVAVPRLRKRMINGISVEGEFVKEESIMDYCRQIITSLQLHGNIGIQVKKSAAGKFLILEINPRVQGTIVAGLGAGINLPLLAVKQALGMPVSEQELQVKWGTRFTRTWEEIFY
jgi:carbamoyl-phosphate synthase large subunit